MDEATDRSKVPKSQCQEVVPKDLQDRAVGREGPQGHRADQKAPEDQEDAEVAHTSLLSVKGAILLRKGPEVLKKRLRRFALTSAY